MFTEIGLEDRDSIISTMIERLGKALRTDLTPEQFNQVSLSFHVYPEEWNHDDEVPKRPSNPALYPDLSRQADTKRVSNASLGRHNGLGARDGWYFARGSRKKIGKEAAAAGTGSSEEVGPAWGLC
jgi:hypothetical protein